MVRKLSKQEQFDRNGDTVVSIKLMRATYHPHADTTRFAFVLKTELETSVQQEVNTKGWISGHDEVGKIIDSIIKKGKAAKTKA